MNKCCCRTSTSYPSSIRRRTAGSRTVCFSDIEAHPIFDFDVLSLGQGAVVSMRVRVGNRVQNASVEGSVRERQPDHVGIAEPVFGYDTGAAVNDDVVRLVAS